MLEEGFLYLSHAEVMEACAQLDSVEIMRNVFRLHGSGQTILPDEAYLGWENDLGERVRSLNLPAYVGGDIKMAGSKIINSNIANPKRGLPRASGLTLLYDNLSVRIQCMMESAYLSSLRTASVSVLAAMLLQGSPIENIAVIGAGVIAQRHIEVLLQHMPGLHTLLVYDVLSKQVDHMHGELAVQLERQGVKWQAVASAEAAIRPAQLIISATTVTEGYIPYAWLQPGAIVINVSLDDVLPDVVLQADLVVVDDWMLVKNDSHRLIGRMYRQGQVVGPDEPLPHGTGRRIDAQLGEIIIGSRPGRKHLEDVVLVNPFGLAIEDIALATHVYRAAQAKKLGQVLPY